MDSRDSSACQLPIAEISVGTRRDSEHASSAQERINAAVQEAVQDVIQAHTRAIERKNRRLVIIALAVMIGAPVTISLLIWNRVGERGLQRDLRAFKAHFEQGAPLNGVWHEEGRAFFKRYGTGFYTDLLCKLKSSDSLPTDTWYGVVVEARELGGDYWLLRVTD